MNENLDLCKILEGCEGITLWCSMVGQVKLQGTQSTMNEHPITVSFHDDLGEYKTFKLTRGGKFFIDYSGGECILFPSKDQRDWSKFVKPIKEGTPMMCRLKEGDWILRYYAGIINGQHRVYRNNKTIADGFQNGMIPFDKFDPNNIDESLKYNIQK